MALLKLPPEIRQKNLRGAPCLRTLQKALPQSAEYSSTSPQARGPHGAQILRVCKTIYHEAVHFLYSRNVFMAWTHNEVGLLELYLLDLFKTILDGGKPHMVWENYSRGAVSRQFDVRSGTLPHPLFRPMNLALYGQSPIQLTHGGLFRSPHTNARTEMVTRVRKCWPGDRYKRNLTAQEPEIGCNNCRPPMPSFPAFLCDVGCDNAKQFRAVQVAITFSPLHNQLLGEIVH